jgi:uncharacterized Zn finger protein
VNAPKRRHNNNNGSTNGNNQQRRRPAPRPAEDFWHAAEPLPELVSIIATPDPTAVLRSLGELPINDDTNVRLQLATVVERAAAIAAALAHTADLLADTSR